MSTKDPLGGELEFLCPKCGAQPGNGCVRLYRSTTKVDARHTTTLLLGGRVHLARPRSAGLRRSDIETLREVSGAWADVPDVEVTRAEMTRLAHNACEEVKKRSKIRDELAELSPASERARERAQERIKMTAGRLSSLSRILPAFLQSARELELDVEPLLTARLEELAMDLWDSGQVD